MDTVRETRNDSEATDGQAATGELLGAVMNYAFGEPRNAVSAVMLDASSAAHAAAEDLDGNQRGDAATLVDQAAEWLGATGRRLLRASPEETVDALSEAAKAKPALYLAGAAAVGAAATLWFQYQRTAQQDAESEAHEE